MVVEQKIKCLKSWLFKANITGQVIDENKSPIPNVTVYRIEKEYYINKEIGSNESRDLRTESAKSDKNGNFKFYEKSRTDWFHTPLDLPIGYCFAEFEIEEKGYEMYKTEFGEFRQYRVENCYACEKVEFKPIIVLKKLNRKPKTKTTNKLN